MSDLQEDITESGGEITGTLKHVDSGELASEYGAGNYIALRFTVNDPGAESVEAGIVPSDDGLVELDEDMNGVFKVADKDAQVLEVVQSAGARRTVQTFGLAGLTVESE